MSHDCMCVCMCYVQSPEKSQDQQSGGGGESQSSHQRPQHVSGNSIMSCTHEIIDALINMGHA